MKPLDLEKAMAGEETVNREKQWCKVVYVHDNIALVVKKDKNNYIYEYWIRHNGTISDYCESPNDVFMKPKTKTLWAVIHKEPYKSLNSIDLYAIGNACEDRDKIANAFTKEEMKTRQLIQFEIEEL